MGRAARRKPRTTDQVGLDLKEQLVAERNNVELLRESVAALERELSDAGWQRLVALSDQEFTPEGLCQLRAICRLYALKNPLIRRGVKLRAAYVWGQGVQISARATGKAEGEQDVNSVIQAFLDGRGNRRSLTGQQAREALERTLGTDGEVPILLVTNPSTGVVRARVFNADELVDIRTNPDDQTEPWYYLRRWQRTTYDESGTPTTSVVERWYPSVDYRPVPRIPAMGGVRVEWGSPLLHVADNGLRWWLRGVPDVYAAIDWAKAYKEFLEDWARLMRSLSRYAWRVKSPASSRAAVRTALATAPSVDQVTGAPLAAGATVRLNPDAQLEAISKSGASFDADSGRPLATMVASALDLPVTMLLADPGQTGARATAETLDRPTELGMGLRRELWGAAYRRICEYVIAEAVRAPRGALKGKVERDGDEEIVTLDGDTDQTIDLVWPDLDDADPDARVKAIVEASSTGTVPPKVVVRLLLTALGVTDVDGILAELTGDDGEFLWPSAPGGNTGTRAVDALNAGDDPASVEGGPMGDGEPDEEPEPPDPGDEDPDENEERP